MSFLDLLISQNTPNLGCLLQFDINPGTHHLGKPSTAGHKTIKQVIIQNKLFARPLLFEFN